MLYHVCSSIFSKPVQQSIIFVGLEMTCNLVICSGLIISQTIDKYFDLATKLNLRQWVFICHQFISHMKLELGQRYLFTAAKPYPDIQICAGNLDGGKDACQVKIMFHLFSFLLTSRPHFFQSILLKLFSPNESNKISPL